MAITTSLIEVNPDQIRPNPDNPRLIFRESEMNQLLESIKAVGIQVPLTLYGDRSHYVLIDGERRWRCAKRLNMRRVPAIVQPKPGHLENILMMFNIHNVRVAWDLMPMAIKLQEVGRLLEADGKSGKPRDIAGITGVPLATVNRALELLDLPQVYRDLLLQEAEKPKDKQTIKPDVFIEINKSKRVVQRYCPEVMQRVSERQYIDALVDKYSSGVINNVVKFRDISRIARAERAGGSANAVVGIIVDLIKRPDYSVAQAFEDSVKANYDVRDVHSRASALISKLQEIESGEALPPEVKQTLLDLRREISRLL